MTTREDIREWFQSGTEINATHMIIMCDSFDYDDYPIYIMPGQDPEREVNVRDGQNMQTVMEIYNLSKPMETQLDEYRSFNY